MKKLLYANQISLLYFREYIGIYFKKIKISLFLILFLVFYSTSVNCQSTINKVNIFINQNNWNIPYSSISNSINNPIIQKIKPPISNSFDAHPGIATLVTPQFDELNENIIFPKMPPGVYKFMFFITNSVSNNEMAYVVVTNSTHFVQGECCPQDCELVCSKDFL